MSSVSVRYVWLCFVLLRLAWTCLPQTGYIHPDEFFQSVEVASGLVSAFAPPFLYPIIYTCREIYRRFRDNGTDACGKQ